MKKRYYDPKVMRKGQGIYETNRLVRDIIYCYKSSDLHNKGFNISYNEFLEILFFN